MDEMIETTTEVTEETTPETAETTETTESVEASAEKPVETPVVSKDDVFREVLSSMGAVNPATNQPFQNEKEWTDYLEDFKRNEQREELQKQGVDPDTLDRLISENPTVKKAEEVIKKAEMDAGQRKIEADLAEIRKYDPSMKSLDDFFSHPKFSEMDAKIQRGYSIKDAYILSNLETISQKKVDAARQATLNNVNSKGHLTTTVGAVSSDKVIPAGVLETYHKMFPGKSDEWIAKQYKKFS